MEHIPFLGHLLGVVTAWGRETSRVRVRLLGDRATYGINGCGAAFKAVDDSLWRAHEGQGQRGSY